MLKGVVDGVGLAVQPSGQSHEGIQEVVVRHLCLVPSEAPVAALDLHNVHDVDVRLRNVAGRSVYVRSNDIAFPGQLDELGSLQQVRVHGVSVQRVEREDVP